MSFDVTSTAQTVIVICTALAAVGAGLAYLFKKVRAGWRRIQFLSRRIETMSEIADAQLSHNGGSSLLDMVRFSANAVQAIEPNHAYAITQFESLAKADQQHTITLEEWARRFEVVERQQKFFRLLLDALLLTLPPDRQREIKALSDRIQTDVENGAA